MDASNEEARDEEEETTIVSISGTPTAVRNTRMPYSQQLAVYLILASLLFERIAFYSIAADLINKLGGRFLGWDYRDILIAGFIFTGTSYISTLIFAVISDAKLGRAKTILLGFSIYLIGYVLAVLITHPKTRQCVCRLKSMNTSSSSPGISNEPCADLILPTIIIIALGAGAVQSNMAVLGAEQILKPKITSRYFDKYMMAMNIGDAIVKLTFSITQKDESNYYTVCIVAIAALVVATVLFLIGWRHYRHVKPYDSVFTNCIPIVINAWQTRSQYKKNKRTTVRANSDSSTSNPMNVVQSLPEENESIGMNQASWTFLDFAKRLNNGRFHDRIVDDVKSLRSAIVVFGFFIPYFIIYSQVNSSFSLQAQYMNTSNDPRKITWVSLADPVTVIIGIFILNMFVYKHWDARNRHISIATKFTVGMIFACVTMCLAGSIEIVRQNECRNNTLLSTNGSSLSIYAQLPQNIGMGLSAIFAMVASYEFAYYAAPRSALSLFMSLRFFLLGTLSFICAVFVYLFPSPPEPSDAICPNNDPSQWSYYAYFFILACLLLLFIPIFIVCQRKFQIIKLNLEKVEHIRSALTSANQDGSSILNNQVVS